MKRIIAAVGSVEVSETGTTVKIRKIRAGGVEIEMERADYHKLLDVLNAQRLHYCRPNRQAFPESVNGPAIINCEEDELGELWVKKSESPDQPYLANRVNFCPFCGYEATEKVEK